MVVVVEMHTCARRAPTAVMESVEKGCIVFVSRLSFCLGCSAVKRDAD